MAFKIPLLDLQSFKTGYFRDVPNFRWADVTDKDEISKGSFGSVIKAHYIPEKRAVVVKRFFGEGKGKKGMYECAVYSDHVTCACSCYKFNNLCKHSLCEQSL